MKKTDLTYILAAFLFLGTAVPAATQEYTVPPVTVSKEKVRSGGKVFLSHVVEERQTLFSISKAYGVSIQEVYDANPTLNLEGEGLKKHQILLIPFKEETAPQAAATEEIKPQPEKTAMNAGGTEPQETEYFIHKARWYEDLGAIARKYNVSKESIMNINGMKDETIKRRQQLRIPRHPGKWEGMKAIETEEEADKASKEVQDSTGRSRKTVDDILSNIFLSEGDHDVNISLLLPFSMKKPTDLMMDFYCGALLAARDQGKDGVNIGLSVYDVSGGAMPVTKEKFAETDFLIGPVSNADIAKTVNASHGESWIVSPLEPKAESLADSIPNVIQAPAPASVQIKDMVSWVKSDLEPGDKVILITQKGGSASSYSSTVVKEMQGSGLTCSTLAFSMLEDGFYNSLSNLMPGNGTARVILASDSEAFAIQVVRNLYLLANRKMNIVLYSTSRIRTFETIEVEQLHGVNLHASVSYFVDYSSPDVQAFVLQYRAVYNTEPSQFAFQGYDLMKSFSTLASRYGKRWERGLGRIELNGLQSDIKLEKSNRGGYINHGIRRVVYGNDYSVRLIR